MRNLNFGSDKHKLFWLEQWKEIQVQAKQIIKAKKSPHPRISLLLEEYYSFGTITDLKDLEEQIMGAIMDELEPRDNPNKQIKLF